MNIRMPIMPGDEAIKLIRKFNQFVPIIATSANFIFQNDVYRIFSLGASSCLIIPINHKKLLLEAINYLPHCERVPKADQKGRRP